jgi:hypothetical protein
MPCVIVPQGTAWFGALDGGGAGMAGHIDQRWNFHAKKGRAHDCDDEQDRGP